MNQITSISSVLIFDIVKGILLGKRKNDKYDLSNLWCLPGGAQEYGETIEECAKRELLEETNLQANTLEFLSYDDLCLPDRHFLHINFYCVNFSGEPINNEPDKFHEWRWFTLSKIPEKTTKATKQVLDCWSMGWVNSYNPNILVSSHPKKHTPKPPKMIYPSSGSSIAIDSLKR